MARRRPPTPKNVNNSLKALLEKGEPIVGKVGYVRCSPSRDDFIDETTVFVKVKVTGVKAECGITILCEVQSGCGQIEISPCEWFDSLPQVASYREREQRIHKAQTEFNKLTSPYYKHQRVIALEAYLAALPKQQQEDFQKHVTDLCGKTKLESVSMHELEKLAKTLVCVTNSLTADETPYDLRN